MGERVSVAPSRSRRSQLLAWLVASFCFLAGIVTTGVSLAAGALPEWGIVAWLVAAPVFGILLLTRTDARRMGWLLLVTALAGALAAIGATVISAPDSIDWLWLIPLSGVGWISWLGLNLVALPMLFPTGEPPSRRWRPLLWAFVATMGLAAVLALFTPELSAFCSEDDPLAADCATWEASGEALAISNCEEEDGVFECDVLLANPLGIAGVPDPEFSVLGSITYVGLLVMAVLALLSMRFQDQVCRLAGASADQVLVRRHWLLRPVDDRGGGSHRRIRSDDSHLHSERHGVRELDRDPSLHLSRHHPLSPV